MRCYRCYFLNADGRIVAMEVVEADTDEDALARAAEMLSGRPHYRGIEVWDCARRIFPQARHGADAAQVEGVGGNIASEDAKGVDGVS